MITHIKIPKRCVSALVAAAFLWACVNSARGGFDYHINVDTSSIQGTTGFLDVQFNPGITPPYESATATINNFKATSAIIDPNGSTSGNVAGTLPGDVRFGNTGGINELTQSIIYGSTVGFDLLLTNGISSMPGSQNFGATFFLQLQDQNNVPLLASGPFDSVLTIDLDPDGTATVTTYPPMNGGPSVATVTAFGVPEPASILLMFTGAVFVLIWLIRMRFVRCNPAP